MLGFGGPGLKIRVLKEHSFLAPVLEGEGRIYRGPNILAYGQFEILGESKTPKTTPPYLYMAFLQPGLYSLQHGLDSLL
jgi:hypothetical protein